MSTSPVHSGRITTTVSVTVQSTTETTGPSTSRRHGNLEGQGDLSGRPPSVRLSDTGSQRIRRPLPEILGGSPQHDTGSLLQSGERSDRFSVSSQVNISISRTESERLGGSHRVPPLEVETPQLRRPSARRSWVAVGATLVAGLKRAGNAVMTEISVTLSIVKLPKIPKRLMGALAGHGIHQTIAVGIPTFVREMVGIGVMHAMRAQPASTAVAVQVSVGVANLAIQGMREFRELRNPAVAARAYFSLSPAQWASKSPAEQALMMLHHRRMSRAMTVVQVSASVTNVALMAHNFSMLDPVRNQGFAGHDHTAALRPLANEVKVGVYAAMRDGLQATFSMVGFTASPTAEPGHEFAAGMSGAAHAAAAATYAAANSASSFLSDALMGAWVPDRGNAISTLMGNTATKMSHAQAWKEVALGAGVSAMANTLAETIDWFQRMEHFANQTGATQHWEPRMTGTDYGRLLDQAPARAAAFNGIFSALTLAGGEMGKSHLPPAVQQFIGNVGLGVMIAMLDSPVSGLWQAEEAVRAEPRPASTLRIEDLEGGDVEGNNGGEISDSNSGSGNTENSTATRLSAGNPVERHRV